MNFIVSSSEISNKLQLLSKVINSKNTLPILNNFLFKLQDNKLTITASDLETTLVSSINLETYSGNGILTIEAKRLIDILKEFPEQPLTFNIDEDNKKVEITSDKGKYSIALREDGNDYPQLPTASAEAKSISLSSEILYTGIEKTFFATADDELRPVMNGIFIEIFEDKINFVASDAHKLVRYIRSDFSSDFTSSFILPKKSASLIKNILLKANEEVSLMFDDKNAFINFEGYNIVCRLVEGNYPSYNSVIPSDNPNKMTIDRVEFYTALKRVSIFSNQASNLIKLVINSNNINILAQDIDFALSADENVSCSYIGDEMQIGFKSTFLIEILSNIDSQEINMEMSDPTRAGIILPADKENENEDVLMLLMPMMINA